MMKSLCNASPYGDKKYLNFVFLRYGCWLQVWLSHKTLFKCFTNN